MTTDNNGSREQEHWPTAPGVVSAGNPLGTAGVEFLEFAAFTDDECQVLTDFFRALGFAEVAKHRTKDVSRFNQGDINLILNREHDCFARSFATVHGLSVCAMGFRVNDAKVAHARALKFGAQSYEGVVNPGELQIPAIRGVFGSLIYYVDRFDDRGSTYEFDFDPCADASADGLAPAGLDAVDHVSITVLPGRTEKWIQFFKECFGFHDWSHHRIDDPGGTVISNVVSSPCNTIHLPINESPDTETNPNRFLSEYFGEGIQHIAFRTKDIFAAVRAIEGNGLGFLPIPSGFYDELAAAGEIDPGLIDELRAHNILIDTEGGGRLLHAYTKPIRDRFFIEIIQRENHVGFGLKNAPVRLEALSALYASHGNARPDERP